MKFKNIITLAFLLLAVSSLAQIQLNLPTTQIGDKEYYRYDSSNGESIYDIAAKLGVTKDYIIQNNPVINNYCNSYVLACLPVGPGRRGGACVCNDSVCAQIGHIGESDISTGINRIEKIVISCEDNRDVVIIFDYVNGLRIRRVF
jgi:hypothetical protein